MDIRLIGTAVAAGLGLLTSWAGTCTINIASPGSGNANYTVTSGCVTLTSSAVDYRIIGYKDVYDVRQFAKALVRADADCTVTVSNAALYAHYFAGFDVNGHRVTLKLIGENHILGGGHYAAVQVPPGSTLTIEGPGTLIGGLTGSSYAACIGSAAYNVTNNADCGTIIIRSGTVAVTAQGSGGQVGAAIGSGWGGDVSLIRIEGGTVTANGGTWGTGIGAGSALNVPAKKGYPGHIVISGGTVTATGGNDGGTGIGSSHPYNVSGAANNFTNAPLIEILGGVVTATAGSTSLRPCAAIGCGLYQPGARVFIDVTAVVTTKVTSATVNHDLCIGGNFTTNGVFAFTNTHQTDYAFAPCLVTLRDDIRNLTGVTNATDATLDALVATTTNTAGYSYSIATTRVDRIIWSGASTMDACWWDSRNWADNHGLPARDLVFAGNTRTTCTNDINALAVNTCTFDTGAAAFTLEGNTFTVTNVVPLLNLSSITQTINCGVSCSYKGTTVFTNANNGGPGFVFGGDFSALWFELKPGSKSLFRGATMTVANTMRIWDAAFVLADGESATIGDVLQLGNEDYNATSGGGTLVVGDGCTLKVNSAINDYPNVNMIIDGTVTANNYGAYNGKSTIRGHGTLNFTSYFAPGTSHVTTFLTDGLRLNLAGLGYYNNLNAYVAVGTNASLVVGALTDWTEHCGVASSGEASQPFVLRSGARLTFDTYDTTSATGRTITCNHSAWSADPDVTIAKVGAGTLIWKANSPYAGAIAVSNGTFEVDVAASNATLTVATGAALKIPTTNTVCAFANATFADGALIDWPGAATATGAMVRVKLLTAATHTGTPSADLLNTAAGTTTWHCIWAGDALYAVNNIYFYLRVADTAGDLSISNAWLLAKYPALASATDVAVSNRLASAGANGVDVWQSYVLGLDPTNAASRILCDAAQDADTGSLTLVSKLPVAAGPSDSGATVTYALEGSANGTDGWTGRFTAASTPRFTLALPQERDRFFRIRADIVTK